MKILGNVILEHSSNKKLNVVIGSCDGGSDCSSLMEEDDEYLCDFDYRK